MGAFESFRYASAGSETPLGGLVQRTAEAGLNPLDITSLRAAGFRALNGMVDSMANMTEFRAAAPLPDGAVKSQVLLDKAVIEVGMERLTFVADLLSEGLVFNLPGALGVPFLEHNTVGRTGTARRVMNPSARGENHIAKMSYGRLPIYLTMTDFQLDIRTLLNSIRIGMPLDTATIKADTRNVNEAIEDAAINGTTTLDGQTFVVDGYSAPGLLTAPNANTKSLSTADWLTTPNGTNIMLAITQMIAQLVADKKYGPYNLYIPTAIAIAWQLDFKANGNDSVMARIERINVGGRPLRVRPLDLLPATKVALVQMTEDVVQLINGQSPTIIPYTSLDGFIVYNVIMAIMVPRFRSDYDGNSGIVIGTTS